MKFSIVLCLAVFASVALSQDQAPAPEQTGALANETANLANQTSAALNQTALPANQTALPANQTAAPVAPQPTMQQQVNRSIETLGIAKIFLPQDLARVILLVQSMGQQQQQGLNLNQSGQLEAQVLQSSMQNLQQLQSQLQGQGAVNASLNSVDIVPDSQGNPSALASIQFFCPINNLQNVLSSVMQGGARGAQNATAAVGAENATAGANASMSSNMNMAVSSISFFPSETTVKLATNQCLQQAVMDAQNQVSSLSSALQGTSGGASTSPQLMHVKVLKTKIHLLPEKEELGAAFLDSINSLLMGLQFGQQQQQNQTALLAYPPTIATTQHVMVKVLAKFQA